MGQQVSRKIAQLVAATFGIGLERILVRVESTSTLTVANTFPTAASTGSDINGMAALAACEEIRGRLLSVAAEVLGAPAAELSMESGHVTRGRLAYTARHGRSSWPRPTRLASTSRPTASIPTPDLVYDAKSEKGSPFAYHVYGCAAVTATVDVLRGSYRFDKVHG